MRRLAYGLMAAGCCLLLGGARQARSQSKIDKDLCSPAPGSVPPALPARLMRGQGGVHMPITTRSAEAQKFFDQGVSQMHSFWAIEAERSFLQAAKLDPEAPMPQWGIAMVAAGDYRPTFQLGGRPRKPPKPGPVRPNVGRARAAAATAQKLSANASRREQLYIAAVAARRNPNSKDPDGNYIEALRALLKEFPQEVEARSYLALALMNGYTTPDKKPRPGTEEAVAILQKLVKEAPDHPGAHHYVIHALEGSTHPQDAWESCQRYPELAPEIPHALHMPGHIYVQSGRFADAAAAFDAAARKEREYLAADQLYPNGHHGHNVHFLATADCFLRDYDGAMKASQELLDIAETPRERKQPTNWYTAHRQGWFARMRTLVAFEKWDEILAGGALPEYPGPRERAWRAWARGLAYAAKGDLPHARGERKAMDRQMKEWRKVAGSESPHLRVARGELAGHIEMHAGHAAKGLDQLERAAHMELALHYNEPPAYPRPVWEAMGREALMARQWGRAQDAFRHALEQNPDSPRAKEGLTAALAGSGKTVTASLGAE
ncbi:MAG TPA: hypothetical protein VEU62_16795 [Bryobacterales bacterium]|nr:hypothetical protein [Bryobacterales bacterium]